MPVALALMLQIFLYDCVHFVVAFETREMRNSGHNDELGARYRCRHRLSLAEMNIVPSDSVWLSAIRLRHPSELAGAFCADILSGAPASA